MDGGQFNAIINVCYSSVVYLNYSYLLRHQKRIQATNPFSSMLSVTLGHIMLSIRFRLRRACTSMLCRSRETSPYTLSTQLAAGRQRREKGRLSPSSRSLWYQE